MTITKKELVDRIANKTQVKRILVKETIQLFLDEVTNELADGNRLEFRGFGVFETQSINGGAKLYHLAGG